MASGSSASSGARFAERAGPAPSPARGTHDRRSRIAERGSKPSTFREPCRCDRSPASPAEGRVSAICPECARRALAARKIERHAGLQGARSLALLEPPGAGRPGVDRGGRRSAQSRAAGAVRRMGARRGARSRGRGERVPSLLGLSAGPTRTRARPRTLSVRGGIERLTGMLEEKVVAIVGTRRATDYGMETARELARGLAASGVTVASGLAEGIPIAAHSGALEAGGQTLTVTAGGVERCSPTWCAALYRRIVGDGCAISEVQDDPCARPAAGGSPPALVRLRCSPSS